MRPGHNESKVQSKHHIYITFLLTFKSRRDIIILKKGEKKMEIRVENAETPLMKNCFIDTKRFSVAGFFGLTHIEIERIGGDFGDFNNELWLNQEEFNELYDMMTEMKKQMKD